MEQGAPIVILSLRDRAKRRTLKSENDGKKLVSVNEVASELGIFRQSVSASE